MTSHLLAGRFNLAACCLLGICANASAAAAALAPDASVVVHATHVVVAGRTYGDLDAAAQALQALGARTVRVDTCLPGTSRALRAVVYRLRDHALAPRVLQADEPACAAAGAAIVPVSTRASVPFAADDPAVELYWDGMSP
jgi:hypothetical protein